MRRLEKKEKKKDSVCRIRRLSPITESFLLQKKIQQEEEDGGEEEEILLLIWVD